MPSPESRSYTAEPGLQEIVPSWEEIPESVFGPPVADTFVEYPLVPIEKPTLSKETQELQQLTQYFDTNYAKEGLPKNWWELNKIGFSMKSQMNLLADTDKDTVQMWNTRTKTDLQGFCLEYLAEGRLIYPVDYTIVTQPDGSKQLKDQTYNKALVETASAQERNGTVVQSLQEITDYLLADTTGVGASALMISPEGKTGLKMDTGADITYPDSYMFAFMKTAPDAVKGFGIRTGLSKRECRELITLFTGKTLSPTAPEEAYVREIACIPAYGNGMEPLHDIVDTIQTARKRIGTHNAHFAYQNVTWETVHADIDKMADLYRFDEETNKYLTAFTTLTEHQATQGTLDPLTAQKELAATVLELCKLYEERKLWQKEAAGRQKQSTTVYSHGEEAPDSYALIPYQRSTLSYGQAYEETSQRPGCAGGGKAAKAGAIGSTVVDSIVLRLGQAIENDMGGKCEKIRCSRCGWEPSNDQADAIAQGDISACVRCGWAPGDSVSPPESADSSDTVDGIEYSWSEPIAVDTSWLDEPQQVTDTTTPAPLPEIVDSSEELVEQ